MGILRSIFLMLFCVNVGFAQNLVTNPSFEDVNIDFLQCNAYQSGMAFNRAVNSWTGLGGTSDLFSLLVNPDCGSYAYPNKNLLNNVGEQKPRTGNVMAGIIIYDRTYPNIAYREYVENKLKEPLIPGQKYKIVFYVSLGDYSYNAADNIGVCFSEQPLLESIQPNIYQLPYVPQIEFKTVVTDYVNWVNLEAEWVATSKYQYITIGNFRDDSSTQIEKVTKLDNAPTYFSGAYYFIDDVSLEPFCEKRHIANSSICYGHSTTLTAPENFKLKGWADSTAPNVIISPKATLEVEPLKSTTYYLYVNACDTLVYKVNVLGSLAVDFGKDVGIYSNQKIILDAHNTSAHYQWQDGSDKQIIEVTQGGKYWVTVSDGYGCSKTDTINIVSINLEMPNVFTPNGDDKNEHFVPIKMSGIISSEMVIYNRWGKQVFKTSDLASGWDGDTAEPGVYYWSLNYTDFNGKESFVKGIVSLLR